MQHLAAVGSRVRGWATSRWIARACAALFVVSVPLALIGGNVRYLFGEQRLYTFAINRYDVPQVAGVPKPELLRATRELRGYLFDASDYLAIQVTDTAGETGPLFSEREVVHMYDVKRLVQRIFRAQELALVVALGYPALRMLLDRRGGARGVLTLTWLTGVGLNLAAIAFAASTALGFDRLFEQFHTLSFSNDFWQLDPSRDHLVQMFPFQFWEISAGLLVGMTLVESALLAVTARWGLSRLDRARARTTAPDDGHGTGRAEQTPEAV